MFGLNSSVIELGSMAFKQLLWATVLFGSWGDWKRMLASKP